MDENQKPNEATESNAESQIVVNDYGTTKDSTVVIEEETRTVLLTDDETIIFEKEPRIDIVPKNRPRKVYAGMWGPTEIATVALGLLAILTTILLFVFLVLPAKKELEANKLERDRIETELTSAKRKYGDITDTETQVAKLLSSVNDFETRFLRNPLLDKTSLYQRINGLISSYGLVNTTGPDYAPLEISDDGKGQETESESGRAKFQSLFPGVYVTTTVEGSYQNLRRFIREIETSEQFVVISAIELEPAENKEENNPTTPTQASISQVQVNPMNPGEVAQNPTFTQTVPQSQQPTIVRGKTRGETVSLRLEMAAYFRRPIIQPTQISTEQ
ncbi:MAG: hypothetical protein M3388_04480 [Acidobacteriota bacterium]|nr:hypothetical protein [Acidobacteriota bacterium]